MSYDSLTVDFAQQMNAGFILRGIRTVNDFEYEKTIADVLIYMALLLSGYDKTGQRNLSARSVSWLSAIVFGYLDWSRWRLRSHASSSFRMVSSIFCGV